MRACLLALTLTVLAAGQSSRILYLTHSAGFRHDSIPASVNVVRQMGIESSEFEIEHTEDAAAITAQNLERFDAVLFFTSGELPLNDAQKRALIAFVENGGGFAGVHSATDTLYGWAEYGELIGGYFDGHPWVQEIYIDVEDPAHPAVAHLAPGFRIYDEIYQFRSLSRENVRVLMTLDPASADLNAAGVQQGTTDFPLAWTRRQGSGRVFYTALGHFEETWRDPRFQQMMLQGLRWAAGRVDADGAARPSPPPSIAGIGNAATFEPAGVVAPGALISVYGENLTPGSNGASSGPGWASKLAGTAVTIKGRPASLLYSSPGQLNVRVPPEISGEKATVEVVVADRSAAAEAAVASATPAIFAVTTVEGAISIWATGLGNTGQPVVRIGGHEARVLYSGMTAEWPGLHQVNAAVPDGTAAGATLVELSMPGSQHTARYEFLLP